VVLVSFLAGLLDRCDEDEMDGADSQLPDLFSNEAFRAASVGCTSTSERGATTSDDEAIAAEYLCVIGDRIQAEYGNRLDALMNELDWTLARDALLADVRRILGNLLSQITDVWTQVYSLIIRTFSILG